MLNKSLLTLSLGVCFMYGQIFANEPSFNSSYEELADLSFWADTADLRNSRDFVMHHSEVEISTNFHQFYDVLDKFISLSKENRTKCLIILFSNAKLRREMSILMEDPQKSELALTVLKNRKNIIAELIDFDLLKEELIKLADSLNLEASIIEYHIDQKEYDQFFTYFLQNT